MKKLKIKTIILFGYLLVAAVAIILSLTGLYFINKLTSSPDRILKDNYKSILAAQVMIDELDNMDNIILQYISGSITPDASDKEFSAARENFLSNLKHCENNITEPGEDELVKELRKISEEYTSLFSDKRQLKDIHKYNSDIAPRYKTVKQKCYELLNLNHKGMLIRRDETVDISRKAEIYMIVISLLSLIFVIAALLKVPSLVVNPIEEFTRKVRAISEKKYSERIPAGANNELGELALSFNEMASKLGEYEKTNIAMLIAEKRRAEAIVKSMVDGIFVLNEKFEILIINNIGEELLGISAENVKGKSAYELATQNSLFSSLITNLQSVHRKDGSKAPDYLRIYYKGKEEFFLKEIVTVSENEKILGFIIILKNVTGFKELDELKSGFVATVSHELRTPLSAMNMSLRLLQDERIGSINPEQKKIIEQMKDEVKRLLKIVTELLNLSKIESGSELLKLQQITADELIDAALTPLLMQFEQKNITIINNIENDLPLLNVDANKIAWVLINLLNNALRYSFEGSKIELNVKRDNGFILFSVKDFGEGIAPQSLNRIFDKFVQLGAKNLENQKKGVGLGLAISKEFVNAHNGKIWVKSEPGRGSEFCFTLPVS